MPKPSTRYDSATDSTSEAPVGVAMADVEIIVKSACQKAVEVLKTELLNMFSEINARLECVEKKLLAVEQKTTEHDKALDELSDRLMNMHCSPDDGIDVADRIKECLQEIDGVRHEARSAICLANDVEQYGRRHNIRIRGLPTKEEQDCRTAVVTFLNDKLCMSVTAEDVEVAHPIPARRSPNIDSNQQVQQENSLQSDRPTKQQPMPVTIVRFRTREIRDSVLRNRRRLKDTRYSIVEDLTALNSKTFTRISKHPDVETAWTWNGKIQVLTKSGIKLNIRPFQSLRVIDNNMSVCDVK